MAITLLQASTIDNQVSPVSRAWGSPLTFGSVALACYAYVDGTNTFRISDVRDNNGNVYALVKRVAANARIAELWMCIGSVAGGPPTVTATFTAAKSGVGVCLLEYQPNTGKIFAIDQQNSQASAVAVSPQPAGSITTTTDDQVIVYVGRSDGGATVTAPAGYTRRSLAALGNNVSCHDRIITAAETTNPAPTPSVAKIYTAMVVSFKEVDDTSGLLLTQQGRYTSYAETVVSARLTQMARYVLYPFTCEVSSPPALEAESILVTKLRWGLQRFDVKRRFEQSN